MTSPGEPDHGRQRSQPLPRVLDLDLLAPSAAPTALPGRCLRGLDALDRAAVAWMRAHGPRRSSWSLALVFFWFGALKVVGLSPAAQTPPGFLPVLGLAE